MKLPFGLVIDRAYSRDDIADLAGIPVEKRKGNWTTGYSTYNGASFVFANADTAARTGHDYGNHWDGDRRFLDWSAKTGTRRGQREIEDLIAPGANVLIFTRDDNRAPWTFRGRGAPTEIQDEVPVRVRWDLSPTRGFLLYWRPETAAQVIDARELTSWMASNQLDRVKAGDELYAVTVVEGRLHLGARLEVGELVRREEALKRFGTGVWDGRWFAIASPGSEQLPRRVDLTRALPALTFNSTSRPRLDLEAGRVNPQQLQTMRELSPEGLKVIRSLWKGPEPQSAATAPVSAAGETATGQGYESDVRVRKAIEVRAMAVAQAWYENAGFTVDDVSRNNPFDLRCTRAGHQEIRVEVKGTRGDGSQVGLTDGEVKSARGEDWQTDLFIVAGIVSTDTPQGIVATGGEARRIERWAPRNEDLRALTFMYSVPPKR